MEKLFSAFAEYQKAEALRQFLGACRSRLIAIHGSDPDPLSREGLWLRWVEARAGMLDPLDGDRFPWTTTEFDRMISGVDPMEQCHY